MTWFAGARGPNPGEGGWPGRGEVALRVAGALVLAALVLHPAASAPRGFGWLWNLAHGPLGALVLAVVGGRAPRWEHLITTTLLLVGVEAVQGVTGRSPGLGDALAGALGALALFLGVRRQRAWALALAVAAAVASQAFEAGAAARTVELAWALRVGGVAELRRAGAEPQDGAVVRLGVVGPALPLSLRGGSFGGAAWPVRPWALRGARRLEVPWVAGADLRGSAIVLRLRDLDGKRHHVAVEPTPGASGLLAVDLRATGGLDPRRIDRVTVFVLDGHGDLDLGPLRFRR